MSSGSFTGSPGSARLRKTSSMSNQSDRERSGSQVVLEDSVIEEDSASIELPPFPRDNNEDDPQPTNELKNVTIGQPPPPPEQAAKPDTNFAQTVATMILIKNVMRRLRQAASKKRSLADKRTSEDIRLENGLLSKIHYSRHPPQMVNRQNSATSSMHAVRTGQSRSPQTPIPEEPDKEEKTQPSSEKGSPKALINAEKAASPDEAGGDDNAADGAACVPTKSEAESEPKVTVVEVPPDPPPPNAVPPPLAPSWRRRFNRLMMGYLKTTVDESGIRYYYWTTLVAVGCLYNLLVIIARFCFIDLQTRNPTLWIVLDLFFDLIFVMDFLFVQSRKGYLEQGVVVTELRPLFKHYSKTPCFWFDVIAIVPTDVLHVFYPGNSLMRMNRLLKSHRLSDFANKVESRTNYPYVFRIMKMMSTIFIFFHWNACIFFLISDHYGIEVEGASEWQFQYQKVQAPQLPHCSVWASGGQELCLYGDNDRFVDNGTLDATYPSESMYEFWWGHENRTFQWPFSNLTRQYVFSMYWSALILTTIGEQNPPRTIGQFLFVTVDILIGLLIFAAIVGTVSSMITSMNAEQAEFEERLDGAKQYMEYKKVDSVLQKRVIKWFNYMATQKQNDESVIDSLPTKLKAELAIHVHLDTLKRVRIFQDCDPGLLIELVLKLKLQVFSPGDYICRKGDVGKEMYIVKGGSLSVVSEDGTIVFVTLKEGSVFGELSVLDIPGNKNGNKRTAAVRSVGYSDLFVLSKDDLWDSLREYPETKKTLLAKGCEILAKDGLLDEAYSNVDAEPVRTLDQQLDNIAEKVKLMNDSLDTLYKAFDLEVSRQKQRVTQLEKIFNQNRRSIKMDCMLGKI